MDFFNEPLYIDGKGNWLNHSKNALDKYNNRVHGTTKMTPFEMSFCAASHTSIHKNIIINHTEGALRKNKLPKFAKFSKFQVGNSVRVSDKRNIYSKVIQQELLGSIFNFDSNNKTLESMNISHKRE